MARTPCATEGTPLEKKAGFSVLYTPFRSANVKKYNMIPPTGGYLYLRERVIPRGTQRGPKESSGKRPFVKRNVGLTVVM